MRGINHEFFERNPVPVPPNPTVYPDFKPRDIGDTQSWGNKHSFDKEDAIFDILDGWVDWEFTSMKYRYPNIEARMPYVMYRWVTNFANGRYLDYSLVKQDNFEHVLTKHFGLSRDKRKYEEVLNTLKPEEIEKLKDARYFTGNCNVGADFRTANDGSPSDSNDSNSNSGFMVS